MSKYVSSSLIRGLQLSVSVDFITSDAPNPDGSSAASEVLTLGVGVGGGGGNSPLQQRLENALIPLNLAADRFQHCISQLSPSLPQREKSFLASLPHSSILTPFSVFCSCDTALTPLIDSWDNDSDSCPGSGHPDV